MRVKPGDVIIVARDDCKLVTGRACEYAVLEAVWSATGTIYIEPTASYHPALINVAPGNIVEESFEEVKPDQGFIYWVRWGVTAPGFYTVIVYGRTLFGLTGNYSDFTEQMPNIGAIPWYELPYDEPSDKWGFWLMPCVTPTIVYHNATDEPRTVELRFVVDKIHFDVIKTFKSRDEAFAEAYLIANRRGTGIHFAWTKFNPA